MTKEEKMMLRELHSSANADQRLILEKFYPELKESEGERIRKTLINEIKIMNARYSLFADVPKDRFIAWLEKQGRQEEPQVYEAEDGEIITYSETDGYKVAAKFHEGDWVVRGDTIAQILDIQEQYYVGIDINGKDFTSSIFLSDDKIHLWTIYDAKDGDILATKDGNPFIFKDCSDDDHPNAPVAYCGINDFNKFIISADNHWWDDSNQVCPATKEQRDTLLKAMDNAKYTFDFETKELIAQDFDEWREEDENMFNHALDMIEWYTDKYEDKAKLVGNWLKSLKYRLQLK